MAARTGASAVVAALEERGVEYLFGVPGHGAYPIYGALTKGSSVRPIVGRNEQGISFIADAWSWVTNRVAVATTVPECGFTNSSTGVWQATEDGERLLYILEYDPMHQDVARATALHYAQANSAEEIRPAFNRLMDLLETGRPGGAVLEIPQRVLVGPAERSGDLPARPKHAAVDAHSLDEAASLLSKARRPVIVAGRPIVAAGAEAALLQLAEKLQAPVFVDRNAKGALSEDHPLALGFTWSPTSVAEDLLREADIVLAIGLREHAATGARSAEQIGQQLIHLDWDTAQQGDGEPARLKLAGHVGDALADLVELVKERQQPGFTSEALDAVREGPWRYAEDRVPWALDFFRELQSALPRDVLFFTDSMVGLWIFRLLKAYEGRSYRFGWGNGSGTLGYGFPGGIGAKLALPDREVVCIAGDGAALYNPQELATMQLYGMKVTYIVCNDDCFGAVRDNLQEGYGAPIGHELVNPDFVKLAEAYGMRGVKTQTPAEIGNALREALAGDQSTLIEVPLELRPGRY
ncbi:MAG TPA: thiamine pyrophosphate-binding protein [Chloroflexota bacterium]|nr:thiamine pyrophosphate-binding protein [Chloroflexota bacterium]